MHLQCTLSLCTKIICHLMRKDAVSLKGFHKVCSVLNWKACCWLFAFRSLFMEDLCPANFGFAHHFYRPVAAGFKRRTD